MARPDGFPSVEETLKHPAYAGVLWGLKPHRRGTLPVAEGRGGPINIAWEIRGDGPVKIVVRPLPGASFPPSFPLCRAPPPLPLPIPPSPPPPLAEGDGDEGQEEERKRKEAGG